MYARFSDPDADLGDGGAVYMAGQFFGAGRVFYLGSGEMWRLRSVDEKYFERIYTKLVRHVSQGRLLRGSKRGVLLVEQDEYLLGDSVSVRAQVKDAQFNPLLQDRVALEVIGPDRVQTISLTGVDGKPGNFGGQFTVFSEGNYKLQLPIEGDEPLLRDIDVKLPDLENANTQRNDALLSQLAQETGGQYYLGMTAALDGGKPITDNTGDATTDNNSADNNSAEASEELKTQPTLVAVLPDRMQIRTLPDRPKTLWDSRNILLLVVGLLCLEWIIRRLSKLA